MCKNPLYAYKPMREVMDERDAIRIVPNKGVWQTQRFSVGEIAPWYPSYIVKKKARPMLFCKDYDSWNVLKEIEPDNIYYQVPCGQCIECRLKYSREWALRLCCENAIADNALFVTLTYDDEHLHLNDFGMSTLVPADYSKFMKDLRRYCQYHYGVDGIRFFCAGEYGSETKRAHFHLIIFNLPQQIHDNLKFYRANFNGDSLYNSEELSKIWSNGYVVVAPFCFKTAAYVARYVTKKMKGTEAKVYKQLHLEPEFAQMSRRPGIGREFYELNKDKIYLNDEVFLPGIHGMKPSKYFDKLYDFDDPISSSLLKVHRQECAERAVANKLSRTELEYEELLRVEEENIKNRIKYLKRGL